MRNYTITTVCLFVCALFFTACSSSLSKDEAKQQIEKYINEQYPLAYFKTTGYIDAKTERQLQAAQAAGYITYTMNGRYVEVSPEEKLGPVEGEGGKIYYDPGKYKVEITSISEPAADATGTVVCHVAYTWQLEPTELGKCFEFTNFPPHDRRNPLTFSKQQDGWQLVRR